MQVPGSLSPDLRALAEETVGNTPCVKISEEICPKGRTIYAKLEYFNPLSSAPRLFQASFL